MRGKEDKYIVIIMIIINKIIWNYSFITEVNLIEVYRCDVKVL